MDPLWPGLTDDQWNQLRPLVPGYYLRPSRKARRRGGRPRASDKKAFEALLWALGGGNLERLPARFAARRTACRRLKAWFPPAILDAMWARYVRMLDDTQAEAWRGIFRHKRRRPFWQQLLITTFRMQRGDYRDGAIIN